ncbi:MAG TPA: tetratricopeptide repeat protein [Candidatus Edwardsbacteria bacterium]|nr:tetratricopeptide repeat protein [Candidatus Edwardsbacteria bacterium]
MAIKGSFREVSLPDVLQLLAVGFKTGCLKVTDGQNFGNIFFSNGRICYTSLLNRPDRLGDRLLSRGLITSQQLQQALDTQQAEGGARRLGDILLQQGLVTTADIQQDISRQIEDAIFFLLRWTDGEFFFEQDTLPEHEPITASLDVMNLLLEEARQVDEWRKLETKLPTPQTVLERVAMESAQEDDLGLNDEERHILKLIDGNRTVAELMEASPLGDFATSKIIYGLLLAGIAKRGSEKSKQVANWKVGVLDEHRNLGIAFYKTQMYDEAAREYRRMVTIKPDDPEARFYLGMIHFRKGEFAEAATEFLEAIAIDPKLASAYNNLGLALEVMGEYDDAARQFRRALEIAPQSPLPRINLAFLSYQKGDFTGALDQLSRLEEEKGQLPLASFLQGLIAYGRNDPEAAAAHWSAAAAGRRPNPAVENNLGAIKYGRGQIEDAERHYLTALKAAPGNATVLGNLVELYYKNGLAAQAVETLLKMDEANVATAADYARLGNLCFKQGQKGEALRHWRRSLELDPGNQMVQRNLALAEKQ